jgi:hypothetical protein
VIPAPGGGGFYFSNYYDGAFGNCTKLTNVVLSTNLTSVGIGAFLNCSNLTSVTLPAGVTSLGNQAFVGCSRLTNITFLGNAPSLGDPVNVFNGSPVTNYYYYPATGWGTTYGGKPAVALGIPFTYTLTNGVVTITGYTGAIGAKITLDVINGYPIVAVGTNALANSSLTSVLVPPTLTNISTAAFAGCSNLTNMMFIGNAPTLGSGAFSNDNALTVYYYSDTAGWGATYGGRPTVAVLPYTCTTNNNAITITGHLGAGIAWTVPASINGYPVTTIGDYAFADGTLTNISIPNSVTYIGNHAFHGCSSLTRVVLPTNLTGIGQYAFFDSLPGANVSIPNSMTSIGEYAFSYCRMSSVSIPNSVTNIADFAFNYCSLGSVTIPGSVKKIGYRSFKLCGLTTAVLQEGVTIIGDEAFSYCEGLTTVSLPDSVTQIGLEAFSNTGLSSVSIPKGVTEISASAFYATAITRLVIPTNVIAIGAGAFSECYALTEVVLPGTVTFLGEQAFFNCPSLTNVIFLGNAPGTETSWFGNNGVPFTVSFYYCAWGWSTNAPDYAAYLFQAGVGLVELKWTPLMRGARVQGGTFSFNFINTNNLPVVVETSGNLVDWQPMWTNSLIASSTNFVDPGWTNYSRRFYRTR